MNWYGVLQLQFHALLTVALSEVEVSVTPRPLYTPLHPAKESKGFEAGWAKTRPEACVEGKNILAGIRTLDSSASRIVVYYTD